jgi:twitching motility protein PilT
VSQRLLPRKNGEGRAVACEIMVNTPLIADLILNQRVGEIREYMAEGRDQYGMQTFDQHLADLVAQNVVTFETALAASTRPADFELQMSMFRSSDRAGAKSDPFTSGSGLT